MKSANITNYKKLITVLAFIAGYLVYRVGQKVIDTILKLTMGL